MGNSRETFFGFCPQKKYNSSHVIIVNKIVLTLDGKGQSEGPCSINK